MGKYRICALVDISDRYDHLVPLYDAGMCGLHDGQTQLPQYSRPVRNASSEKNTKRKKAINQING
jgi:hypothetical protein